MASHGEKDRIYLKGLNGMRVVESGDSIQLWIEDRDALIMSHVLACVPRACQGLPGEHTPTYDVTLGHHITEGLSQQAASGRPHRLKI